MTKARNIADLLDANGDVKSASLDNVPASDNASALTSGTLPNARLPDNISDGGTAGTKVALGTTAQRGTTQGQFRYNTTTGKFEGFDGANFHELVPPPTISSVDDTNVDSAGGGNQTFVITGTNFNSGDVISFISNNGTTFNASSTTINSGTQITAVVPKSSFINAQEPYDIQLSASAGANAFLNNQINVDNVPAWNTNSGSLGSSNYNTNINVTPTATDPEGETVTYAIQSGAIPTGTSLNTSTGAITGDPANSASTYNFTLRATSSSGTADRAFSYTVSLPPTTAYYLMVAGGGAGGSGSSSGGYGGGGGGAGGYKTNYGSSTITLNSGTVYAITVGARGSAQNFQASATSAQDGGDSTFYGYTVNGGGAGGRGNDAARTGGSAGGHGGNTTGITTSTNNNGTGSNGGASSGSGSPYSGGGGGGAGGAGGQASGSTLGVGGNGVQNAITGSNLYYAAGGGGATWSDGYSGSQGWSQTNGIGGRGVARVGSGTDGNTNTGSGGGGGGATTMSNSGNSHNGGSGVVILRLATASYSGTTSGSPTVTQDGTDTIIKFTGNGSYTA